MAKVGIISLGCPRNLVDSEVMLGSLKRSGFGIADIEDGVDICIVNTCSFVESARAESIDTILEAARLKKEGRIKYLVVCGCLSQLYKKTLLKKIPEIDIVIGTSDIPKMAGLLKAIEGRKQHSAVTGSLDYLYDENAPRFLLTPAHYAYVKISEGCSNFCSYCIISKMRGNFRSRTTESVIGEIGNLSRGGALKEVNLIGQDTTLFGADRYSKSRFPELLKRICALKNNVEWVRILYTHPAHYTASLISTIRHERKICRYLDLPVQHISDRILGRMNRHTTGKEIIALIEDLRARIKGLVLRTSIIVGFPGESERDFRELLDFVQKTRFEKLGVFIYSKEARTKAARFAGQVPAKVKEARFDELMKAQQKVSAGINHCMLGSTVKVLIDEKIPEEKDKFLGRTEGDAPEVDGSVYVSGKGIRVGEFYKVKITDTLEYDLVGELI